MKFRKRGDRTEVGQKFDIKNTFWIKAGKKINVYDYIQSESEDTDIYKTLEKYGSLEKIELDHKGFYGDFETMDKMALHEKLKKAEELWGGLPIEVKTEFNNDKLKFMQEGKDWLQKKIKSISMQQQETKPEIKEGVNQNEQK